MEARDADRPAEHVVPPALQHRRHPGALSRLQARGGLRPQRPGRTEGVDQQAPRRRPDRLRRRIADRARDVLRGAGEERPSAEHGHGLRCRDRGSAAAAERARADSVTHPVTGRHGHDDHDDEPDVPLEGSRVWQQKNVALRSVGVDIGSSGTQVAFSRLYLRRLSENLTSRYVVVRRELHFQSDVEFTPYTEDMRIDAAALGKILDQAYAEAGVTPDDVDTGVVILTGEALRRQNAQAIAAVASEHAGDLVCASAGHHMEAMLAAYGSGAVRASHRDRSRLLNVDIGGGTTKLTVVEDGRITATAAFHVGGGLVAPGGGGTTKLTVVEDGRITATAAFHVGGRLVALGEDGTVVRLEPGGLRHARHAGGRLELGAAAGPGALAAIADRMAAELLRVLRGAPSADPSLWLTDPLPALGQLDGLVFSGGVAEYIEGTETRAFGDLGP